MSSRSIIFGPITLSSPADKLSLDVEYEVDMRLPSGKLGTVSVGECLEALASGEVWVARGNSCRIDFRVSLDGEELAQTNNIHIIELLGKSIAESKIWAQLGLSTILHLQNGIIYLHLNYDEPSSLPVVDSRPWSCTTTDIKTPEALLCAQMDRLTVSLAFRSTAARNQVSKRVRSSSQNPVIGKNSTKRIKITPSSTPTKSSITKLIPHEMAGLLKECSDDLYSSITLHVIPALSQLSSFVSSGQFSKFPSPMRTIAPQKSRKRRVASPIKSPNTETGTLEKMGNYPVRPKDKATDEMLLLPGDEGNSIQPLKINSLSSLTIKTFPRKRHASGFNRGMAYALDPTASSNLVNAAMRIMIADTSPRQKTTKGLKIYNTLNTSATSLASLTPVMFSPGFKKSVAHNSHYIPRIVQMMTSLARSAQTPSLRQKLAQIANFPTSEFTNDRDDARINGGLGSEKRLAAVIQARLWSMMQRTLHDPLAARQATNKRSSRENAFLAEENDVYDDLLETIGTENDMEDLKMEEDDFRWVIDDDCSEKSAFDSILSDYDGTLGDEFDDLLDDEGEILLSDEVRERLEIESETEEMLFGRCWQAEDDEQYDNLLLVVEGSSQDELLLDNQGDVVLGEELSFGNDDMLLI
ncbi:hypothetical protein DSL72_001156 [Monilinia vaccinii-corymbosi]|uniref:Uncharacterized protein n=1 Tax=Monilinia vaccinii-corymbosi TaxID=61207 RepID=A0A8A3P9Y4_9HELO|nr:hypothetical protein DSL72_001156 [Monilinia vaccinii-corymbosi]